MHKFLKFIFGIKLYKFRTVPLSIFRSVSLYTFLKFIFGIKLYMFRTVPLSIIRSVSLYTFLKFIFGIKLYMFRAVPLSIISFSLYTQQWYMSYSRIRTELDPSWSCSQPVSKPVWHIPLLCVQWKTPDDGQRNCPKHVAFYTKNTFEKLVHLVGFIIRI